MNALAHSTGSILQSLDLSAMSYAELKLLNEDIRKAADLQCQAEREALINGFASNLRALGVVDHELLAQLKADIMMKVSGGGKPSTLQLSGSHIDKAGKRPEAGKTYRLPNGTTWSKIRGPGTPKKVFVEHIHHTGATWAELETAVQTAQV